MSVSEARKLLGTRKYTSVIHVVGGVIRKELCKKRRAVKQDHLLQKHKLETCRKPKNVSL